MDLGGVRRFLARWAAGDDRRPRLVRRVTVHCPHTRAAVEIDLEVEPTGHPARVLRCSGRPDRPPHCDQACRLAAEAVAAPAHALIILPPGHTVPEPLD